MLLGVDIVGEDAIDKLLGPQKGGTERQTGTTTDGDAKTEDSEERPGWDNDSASSSSHFVSAFGGNDGGASRLTPLSAEAAAGKASALGGGMRVALAKIAPSSRDLSASDMPVRRVSFHQRLSTSGRLEPVVSPTAEEELPTTSSPAEK